MEPTSLRHRSQSRSFTKTFVLLVSQLLKRRSEVLSSVFVAVRQATTAVIRLGELHVLRDLLRNEFAVEAKVYGAARACVAARAWAVHGGTNSEALNPKPT